MNVHTLIQVVAEAQSVSEALGVPLYRAGDKIVPDPQLTDLSEDLDDDQWDDHGSINSSGSGMSVNVAAEKVSAKLSQEQREERNHPTPVHEKEINAPPSPPYILRSMYNHHLLYFSRSCRVPVPVLVLVVSDVRAD